MRLASRLATVTRQAPQWGLIQEPLPTNRLYAGCWNMANKPCLFESPTA
jgi:hypothetical protein